MLIVIADVSEESNLRVLLLFLYLIS